jgi:outer membrane protein assembly factor BamB
VDGAAALALHGSGDVLAAGGRWTGAAIDVAAVARLAAADGRVVWSRDLRLDPGAFAVRVALAAGRDGAPALLITAFHPSPHPEPAAARAVAAQLDGERGVVRWQVALDREDLPLHGTELALLPDDDVVVAGARRIAAAQPDAALARLAGKDGRVRWQLEENGSGAGEDRAAGIAADADGNVFVAGTVQNAYPAGSYDLALVKLDRRGEELWRREVTGVSRFFTSSFDEGLDVVVDSAGDAIVGGQVDNAAFDSDAAIIKVDGATGVQRWRTLLHAADGGGERDGFRQVVVDGRDDVVVLALLVNRAGRSVPTVITLAGNTGAERWRQPLLPDSPSSQGVAGIAILHDGGVAAAGFVYNAVPGRFDVVAAAYDGASGAERWRRVVPDATASVLGVDAAGRVVLGGGSPSLGPSSDAFIVRLDPDSGAEVGRAIVSEPGLRPAYTARLAFDATGGCAASGVDADTNGFVTMLDAQDRLVWQQRVRHAAGVPGTLFPVAAGLAIARDGSVVAGFSLPDGAGQPDWTIVSLSARGGAERRRRTIDGDESFPDDGLEPHRIDVDLLWDLALAPRGDVLAVGVTRWIETAEDFTVVALRGRNGRDRFGRSARSRASLSPP